jgi:hypothetical protein
MGRWAQRTRRGSTPTSSEPAPVATLQDITCDGSATVVLTFDIAVTTPGGGVDASLDVNGDPLGPFGGQTGTSITCITSGGGHNPGEPWTLSSQPPWLTTAVTNPAAGTTI